MTDLRSALERYLSMRKGLGYKYQHQTRRLTDFVSFMEKCAAATITTKLALEWATLPPDRHASWALRLSDVRGFARHVANLDPRTEVPPVGMLPSLKRAKPYVYSDFEINALLAAALALPPEDGLRRWTYHTLFGLIAVTGMRLSEAMGLEHGDVDLRAHASSDQVRQVAPRALASDDVHGAAPPTSIGAPHISEPVAARPSSSPSRAAGCCTSTCTASSGACRARSVCVALAIEPGHASMTSGIPLRSGRCSAGIAMVETSRRSCLHSPHISATPACAIPTGTSRPARS